MKFTKDNVKLVDGYEATSDDYVLKISQDVDAESPREWDNLTTMVCSHKRYNLGDKHLYDTDDYDGWDELRKAFEADNDVLLARPLYLYDHSGGITIKTTPFSNGWDSGQVGWVFITRDQLELLGSPEDKLEKLLESEVETYDQFLTGEVYGFNLVKKSFCKCCKHSNEEDVDSSWGYHDLESLLEVVNQNIED